ncbi:antibiotic biosynthesis monooxygenase, partial [Mesorhizobium sp. M8A.F.Ca.ET.167.01.1.1]|uniref:antibiotic biosynthesis monooxygenase family protein n=1 Tax=Mesorhizobium sp. M8A.F.Ca.ET.167.01.1.1 TaxID=2563961 RepID=UPI00113AAB5E
MAETLEIVTFRLKPGTEAGFVASNGLVSDWLARQPGFLSRHLGRREDGTWVDIVRWRSMEQARAAADRIMAEIGDSE